MTSVQIKGVPEETHRVLRRRAAEAHQSLQEYLLAHLIDQASRPTMSEVLARTAGRAACHLSADDVLDAIDAGRRRA